MAQTAEAFDAVEIKWTDIPLNDTTTLKVRVLTRSDETYVDLRQFVKSERYTGFTKKGVWIPLSAVAPLIEALKDSADAAEAFAKD